MSVRLVTGVPGSGKSYYVAYAISELGRYEAVSGTWALPADVQLFASMDGLRVPFRSLDELVARRGLVEVFQVDFWRELVREDKRGIVVIDEAQRWFSSAARLPDSVWFWFEYHRHLGLEVYLVTQSAASMHRRVLAVADAYIEAAPPSLRLGRGFRYRRRDTTTNEVIGRYRLSARREVFELYRSAEHANGIKRERSALVRYAGAAAVLVGGGLIAAPVVYSWALEDRVRAEPVAAVEGRAPQGMLARPAPSNTLLPGDLQRLRLATVRPAPLEELPLTCSPYTSGTFRCGPYPRTVEDLPGAMCSEQACVVLLQAPQAGAGASESAAPAAGEGEGVQATEG